MTVSDPVVPVGRELEVPQLERFLASNAGAARGLVLSGEPGIGKTVLWESGVDVARARGFRVLCVRASEAEARLSFAGLADLLDGVEASVIDALPPPQGNALQIAVRRAQPSGAASEPFAISAGLLGMLRALADRERVVVAVDDLPWLDSESANALMFAARRLAAHDVRFLMSRRAGSSATLERLLEPGLVCLELGPLSFGAISRLLSERFDVGLPRRVLRQLFDVSRGNPLFAIELARGLHEHGLPEIGAALPVPQMVDELFGARVTALPLNVRRALLAVSLGGGLRREELATVVDPVALGDAERSGVLIVGGSHVRAAHPLLAEAIARRSSARERRKMHLTLAGAVSDPVLRARHLAWASSEPDADLARDVSAASSLANDRGAVHDAVALAEHALRLTPPGDIAGDERLLTLARCLGRAGEYTRVTELLAPRIDTLAAGPERAVAHLLIAEAATAGGDPEEHLARALAQSADYPALRAGALAKLSMLHSLGRVAGIGEGEEMAREALESAPSADPDSTRRALVALAWARIMRGHPIDDLLRLSAESAITTSLHEGSVERPAAVRLAFRGELERAREVLRRQLAQADERGEARSGAALHLQLCELELRAGDAVAAAELLAEWEPWMVGMPEAWTLRARMQALLAAYVGETEQARELGESVLSASSSAGWDRLEVLRARGLVSLFEREPEQAVTSLEAVWEHTAREGVDDPGAFPVAGDLVEALAEAGRLDSATDVIVRLDRLAREQQHPWGLATAKRSAAVVQLAGGYDDGAAEALAEASAEYRALGLGFDCARALLVLGRVQRRAKKRAAARASLEEAGSTFEQLGCRGWAEHARSELARVSGRRAAQDGALTPTEQRVAELVVAGMSNKEAAAQLFVSVYTVEAHLSSVYAKLRIRSRTQLATRLNDAPPLD